MSKRYRRLARETVKVKHKIEIIVTEEGQFRLSAPLDYPCIALKMLETARQAILEQGAAKEQQGAIEIAPAGAIPPSNGPVNRLRAT
jgi:hypothetical protein